MYETAGICLIHTAKQVTKFIITSASIKYGTGLRLTHQETKVLLRTGNP